MMSNGSEEIVRLKYAPSKNPPEIKYKTARPVDSDMHDTAYVAKKTRQKPKHQRFVDHMRATEKIKREGLFPVAASW